MLVLVPTIFAIGGLALWVFLSSPTDVIEEIPELKDIPAASAPTIVPGTSESVPVVPSPTDPPAERDPNLTGPPIIPPAEVDIPAIPAPVVDMPTVDLLTPSAYDEQRSRLQDALNASPIVKVKLIVDEEEPEQGTSPSGELADQYTLMPGSVIPSVLLQGINTDLPGIAVAQVSRDVYDSKTGTRLLLPRGSRIFGTYGSDDLLSDQRVLVNWERIDLPNGDTIELAKVIGADQSGNSGLKDQVHRRTARALTVTGLTSLITAGLTHAANTNDPEVLRETTDGRFVQEPSYADEATREVAQNYSNIVNKIAQRHLDRGPTLTIRPGYEFAIQIAEEISLNPYLP